MTGKIPGYLGLLLSGWALLLVAGCGNPDKANAAKASSETAKTGSSSSEVPHLKEGKAVYTTHCLVCHQATGGGVPNLNPPLKQTEYVLGDKNKLIQIILQGSNKGLPVNGMTYSNAMPSFSQLSNEEIAFVATYIRNSFGNMADAVSASDVATVRKLE